MEEKLRVGLLIVALLNFLPHSFTKSETLNLQQIYRKNGVGAGTFGWSVAEAGDVNGDGKADFIVGNYLASPGGVLAAGSAFVYSGADGSLLYQINGTETDDWLGFSVAGSGDVNGDGKDDFLVGSPKANPNAVNDGGAAFVYSGSDGTLLYQENGSSPSEALGWAVAKMGDINNDGKSEFIIGAPDSGFVYVFDGASGDTIFQKSGTEPFNNFGYSIIGAQQASPNDSSFAGSAYVFSGIDGDLLHQIDGIASVDRLGFSVALIGDINADGKVDFVVGAPYADPGGVDAAGSAYVYSGSNGSLLLQVDGDSLGQLLGESVAGGKDIDGDGTADFMIGARFASPQGIIWAGTVLIYSGATKNLIYQINGSGEADWLGNSVASMGDLSSDGRTDIIVGAPSVDSGNTYAYGSVYVYGLVPTDAPEEKQNRPNQFELSQNYPNPFNPTTTIRYFLPKREKVTLEIFNLAGQRIRAMANGEQAAGEHAIIWDGKDERGKILPSGIYFYKLTAKDFTETKKMILLK